MDYKISLYHLMENCSGILERIRQVESLTFEIREMSRMLQDCVSEYVTLYARQQMHVDLSEMDDADSMIETLEALDEYEVRYPMTSSQRKQLRKWVEPGLQIDPNREISFLCPAKRCHRPYDAYTMELVAGTLNDKDEELPF